MLGKIFGFGRKGGGDTREIMDTGVDVSMAYCPRCGDEYRAEITRCVSCDVGLISGAEKHQQRQQEADSRTARNQKISENDELAVIRTGKLRDLKPVQQILAREMIPSILTGESAGCGKG